jgi:hypothetical protein
VAEVSARLKAAEDAYANLDVDGFTLSLDEATLALPCVTDVVTPAVSAEYLRMLGIRYFVERAPAKSDLAFAAARTLEPAYVFPDTLILPGHAIRAHYAAMDLANVHLSTVPPPRTGSLLFDGKPGTARPDVPVIVQVLDAKGAVVVTKVVLPDDPLPPYEPSAPIASATFSGGAAPDPVPPPTVNPLAAVSPTPSQPSRHSSARLPLLVGAGGAAVGSGILYALAAGSAADFAAWHEDDTLDALDARRTRTNTLVVASAGAGVLAVAGGVGAVLVGHW